MNKLTTPRCQHCKSKLKFMGQWEFNLQIIDDRYLFICINPECRQNYVCDSKETSHYIPNIPYQPTLVS